MDDDFIKILFGWLLKTLGIVIGVVAIYHLFYPIYNVWQSTLAGEAELKQAEWNSKIAISQAQAKRAAAIELAQAEIERAKGVAQANKIIGQSLEGNEAYLRYLWIHNIEDTKDQIIYVPTEAGLPILEAHRFEENRKINAETRRKP